VSRAVSEKCHLMQHAGCSRCGCRCHQQARHFADVSAYSGRYEVPPFASRDLVAHLQSGTERLTLDQAVRVAFIVLDLGWRPLAPAEADVPAVVDVAVQEALL
jgi:hypothetical protein